MKRLTNEECIQDMIEASKGVRTKDSAETWLRLAEIENILGDDYDLERLKVMINQCMTMREEVNERFDLTKYIPVDELKELVEAYKDGRCLILTEEQKRFAEEMTKNGMFGGKGGCDK